MPGFEDRCHERDARPDILEELRLSRDLGGSLEQEKERDGGRDEDRVNLQRGATEKREVRLLDNET